MMCKMNKFLLSVIAFLVVSFSNMSFAGEIDILVEKLVAKGILTPVEGQVILEETKQEVAKEIVQGKSYAVPEWVQNTKLKGDLRLRYQWEDKTDSIDRRRERYRFRLGVESKINDNMKAHAGLATGGDDPRSTNETMDDTFETKGAMLDYAYAEWLAAPWATLKAGKIKGVKNCLFTTSDLLWDSDINPEGVSLLLSKKMGNCDLFMNAGYWILDEWSASAHDPSMYVIQPGCKYKFNKNTHLKAGVACYNFENIVGKSRLEHSSETNTTTLKGGSRYLKYSYNSINPNIELGMKQPFGGLVPYAAVFGEYVVNPDRSKEHEGYLAGVKFGAKKVKKLHDWQFKYMYRELERDAWLDTFPDSDAMGGETDIRGHEVILAYGLGENTSLGFDYITCAILEIRIIRIGINNLAGVPSVVFGLFGLAVFVKFFGFGISVLSGGLTLGILILPTIIRASEESLLVVPQSFREASLALGATKWQTIRKIVLPNSISGILTGSILGIGRAAGETAPILFTAVTFYSMKLPRSIFSEVQALPYHIYALMTEGTHPEAQVSIAYGTALVLVFLVLGIDLIAIIIRNRFRRSKKW